MTVDRKTLEAIAQSFTPAYPEGDFATLRSIFSPDAPVWHNSDAATQSLEENLSVLKSVKASQRSIAYREVRQHYFDNGWVQQHTVTGETLAGSRLRRLYRRRGPHSKT